jgi:hypothetical protein
LRRIQQGERDPKPPVVVSRREWDALRHWLTSGGVEVVDESDESMQHGA